MSFGTALTIGADALSIFGDKEIAKLLSLGGSAYGKYAAAQEAEETNELLKQSLADQRAVAENEMSYRNAVRDRMLSETSSLRATLTAAAQALGPYDIGLDETDFVNRKNAIMNTKMTALNQLVDRVASQGTADLIRRGLADGVSHSADRQAEVLAQFAPQVNQIMSDSTTQALAEYTGLNEDLYKNRTRALEEIENIYGAPLEYESKLLGSDPSSAFGDVASGLSDLLDTHSANAGGASKAYGDLLNTFRQENDSFRRNIGTYSKGYEPKLTTTSGEDYDPFNGWL